MGIVGGTHWWLVNMGCRTGQKAIMPCSPFISHNRTSSYVYRKSNYHMYIEHPIYKSDVLYAGLYTEISPRGGKFGVWTKEGGAHRAEAQWWYHVRCYTLGGARMTQGGENAPPPAPP